VLIEIFEAQRNSLESLYVRGLFDDYDVALSLSLVTLSNLRCLRIALYGKGFVVNIKSEKFDC
jgi:hypothetical protein